ncbi:carbohydrate ABC transporter permease [Lachnospiraceae bacterium AM48-27BH]|jgi:multiple sugar transport system permease protein|nr:carbohydrate ABC transporter permease [Lachnospiraceae bacterium AM48-27BH]
MGAVRKDGRYFVKRILLYMLILALAAVMLVPFLWMISASLKLNKDVFTYPVKWIPEKLEWSNYSKIWKEIPLLLFFKNSAKLTIIITAIQVFTSSFAAYAFAKLHFKGRDLLFILYICTIAVPWQVYMVPQYIMVGKMSLTDSHLGMIMMQSFTAMGVFLMRQFYTSIPDELCEAARIDGLTEYGIYFRVVLPLAKGGIATLIISSFVTVWNDFMGPLIYLSSLEKKTLQLGLRMFISQYSSEYNLIMAASIVSLIPVFVMFAALQKFFTEGIAASGIKG